MNNRISGLAKYPDIQIQVLKSSRPANFGRGQPVWKRSFILELIGEIGNWIWSHFGWGYELV